LRLRPEPLVAKHDLTARAGIQDALGVRVTAAAGVTFGGDQHMLA
jgi:hypothetical protein